MNRICVSLNLSRAFHASASVRARGIKPYNVGLEGEYRKARSKKIFKVELPDFKKMADDKTMQPEEYISKLKERGVAPPRKYKEIPIAITTLQGVLDPYVPPEGDGKFSVLSSDVSSKQFQFFMVSIFSILNLGCCTKRQAIETKNQFHACCA